MSRMFCRSLYAFSGKHDQALKFEVGEIIEVLQPLDSGWWEGQIAGVRGWFPANYVKVLEVSQMGYYGVSHSHIAQLHVS